MVCIWFKQKTAYDMRMSDWSSDVCSSDLAGVAGNQNTTPCSGHSLQRRADRINCAAIAGEFVILPHASTQRLIFAPQAVSFRGAGHQVEQLIGLKRLFNKIHGAFADRRNSGVDLALA